MSTDYGFGPFILDRQRGRLLREGRPVAVSSRGLRLLEALLGSPGRVLTKTELMLAAWGDAAVEESNLSVQIAALRKQLGPTADGGEWITTIPRMGYSEAAIRMSPHDPQDVIFYGGLAAAHYLAGRYNEAINNALRLLQHRPTFTGALRLRVAALAQAGRLDEARAALEGLKELQPDLSIAWIEENVPYTPASMAKFLEGWRKVGLQ